MAFSYAAGTTTPNLAGLAEIGTIRINDGTYELHSCGRLIESAPLRTGLATLPYDHGASTGTPLYTEFPFTIEGRLNVPVLADVWGAVDLLLQTFNLDSGLQTLTLNTSGWSAARQMSVLVGGQVQIIEPPELAKLVPDRDFSVPLVAPDPRLYSVTQHSQTITTSTAVSNVGTASTPITVRFNGPQTNPKLDRAGTSGTQRIRFAGVITSGHWVEVTMWPTTTAVDDLGNNMYGSNAFGNGVSSDSAPVLPVGSSSWTATNDA